jgi:hypothetical protein
MRLVWIWLAAIFTLTMSQIAWAQSTYERNTDRPGGDYTSFDIGGGPAVCRSACANDQRCVAWTFVRENVQAPSQRCWLKTSVGPPSFSRCCVSGVMTAAPEALGTGQRSDLAQVDPGCCPNNALTCPAGRHFCTTAAADAAAARKQPYNPAWQAAPGDTRCCPNSMLVCPTPRHFCAK